MEESREQRPERSEDIPEASASGEHLTVDEGAQPLWGAPPVVGSPAGGQRNVVLTAAATAIVAFAAVGIFVLGMFTHAMVDSDGGGGGTPAQAAQPGQGAAAVQPTAAPQPAVEATVDDDPSRGPEDAAVTIIEFSDFQCPYCARFQQQTLPQILSEYGDRVRFVYRDFPLTSIHPNALKAAEASECADDQGKYWEYHDLLFQNQSALDEESLKAYAASLGVDTDAFNECLDSNKHMSEVRKDLEDGIAAGVQGTPAFFINGQLVSGAQPFAAFQSVIEAALEDAGG